MAQVIGNSLLTYFKFTAVSRGWAEEAVQQLNDMIKDTPKREKEWMVQTLITKYGNQLTEDGKFFKERRESSSEDTEIQGQPGESKTPLNPRHHRDMPQKTAKMTTPCTDFEVTTEHEAIIQEMGVPGPSGIQGVS